MASHAILDLISPYPYGNSTLIDTYNMYVTLMTMVDDYNDSDILIPMFYMINILSFSILYSISLMYFCCGIDCRFRSSC